LDFIEIFILARQSYMRRKCQSAFAINNEGGRQRIDTAVQLTDGIVAQENTVIHLMRCNVRFDRFPALFVHGNTDDLEPSALELLLEFDEPWDLETTGTAPRGPEIQENDLPTQIAQ